VQFFYRKKLAEEIKDSYAFGYKIIKIAMSSSLAVVTLLVHWIT